MKCPLCNKSDEVMSYPSGKTYCHDCGEWFVAVKPTIKNPLPKTPPDGLLHSMAIRYDHGLGLPGYYDTFPDTDEGAHERKYQATIRIMSQLYEEVSGYGFYKWDDLDKS